MTERLWHSAGQAYGTALVDVHAVQAPAVRYPARRLSVHPRDTQYGENCIDSGRGTIADLDVHVALNHGAKYSLLGQMRVGAGAHSKHMNPLDARHTDT